jgi:hypothetical protein
MNCIEANPLAGSCAKANYPLYNTSKVPRYLNQRFRTLLTIHCVKEVLKWKTLSQQKLEET